jgi:hypothetical protein
MHARLDAALAMVEKVFRETTLAEILMEPTGGDFQCNFPRAKSRKHSGRPSRRT